MNEDEHGGDVAAVRSFNRFYTRVIGVLGAGLAHTPHSLTEARVLYELAQRDATEAGELRREIDLDPGYLSRVLAKLDAAGLVTRERSASDARRQIVRLSDRGREAFARLDERASDEVRTLLGRLTDEDGRRLLAAMDTIRAVLGDAPRREPFVLRPPLPGDYGWVVHRHGVVYAEEYGWDAGFEALVARLVADYAEKHDPALLPW
jgi:DNA-binding MarR family transcriptional regulator